jgi:hypothetical protein
MGNLDLASLNSSIAAIEEANELKIIERNNEIRLKFQAEARRRIVFVWLPLIGLFLIILGWFIINAPNYQGCVQDCIGSGDYVGARANESCELYCNLKYD